MNFQNVNMYPQLHLPFDFPNLYQPAVQQQQLHWPTNLHEQSKTPSSLLYDPPKDTFQIIRTPNQSHPIQNKEGLIDLIKQECFKEICNNNKKIKLRFRHNDSGFFYPNVIKVTQHRKDLTNIFQEFIILVKIENENIDLLTIRKSLKIRLMANTIDASFLATQTAMEFKAEDIELEVENDYLKIIVKRHSRDKVLNVCPFALRKKTNLESKSFRNSIREIFVCFLNGVRLYKEAISVAIICAESLKSNSLWVKDQDKIELMFDKLNKIKFIRETDYFSSEEYIDFQIAPKKRNFESINNLFESMDEVKGGELTRPLKKIKQNPSITAIKNEYLEKIFNNQSSSKLFLPITDICYFYSNLMKASTGKKFNVNKFKPFYVEVKLKHNLKILDINTKKEIWNSLRIELFANLMCEDQLIRKTETEAVFTVQPDDLSVINGYLKIFVKGQLIPRVLAINPYRLQSKSECTDNFENAARALVVSFTVNGIYYNEKINVALINENSFVKKPCPWLTDEDKIGLLYQKLINLEFNELSNYEKNIETQQNRMQQDQHDDILKNCNERNFEHNFNIAEAKEVLKGIDSFVTKADDAFLPLKNNDEVKDEGLFFMLNDESYMFSDDPIDEHLLIKLGHELDENSFFSFNENW